MCGEEERRRLGRGYRARAKVSCTCTRLSQSERVNTILKYREYRATSTIIEPLELPSSNFKYTTTTSPPFIVTCHVFSGKAKGTRDSAFTSSSSPREVWL